MLKKSSMAIGVLAVAMVVSFAVPAGATKGSGNAPRQLADGLVGPLAIDVTYRGDVLVGEAFAGRVSKVSRHGGSEVLFEDEGASAVADTKWGSVTYTVSNPEIALGQLKVRNRHGDTRLVADLAAYEAANNPDSDQSYGFEEISDECAAQWPVEEAGPPQYTGAVDSNPYAIAQAFGGTLVADAGANDILFVSRRGDVRTVAVLPPQPILLTAELADALGLADCFVGLTYNFEPVPTDVEAHHGRLYVSTLPGGPEDPSLGARGSVYKVNPFTGSSHRLATGFLGATDLAVSPRGSVYVTELFAGRVSKVTAKGNQTVAELPEPAAIEWARGRLYVAYDVFADGKVGTIHG